MNFVLDTNAAIFLHADRLAEPPPAGRYFLSVISEIELLSFSGLDREQEEALEALLSDLAIVPLDEQVKRVAIDLRRRHRLRLPDAVIAATAVVMNATLLTNDAKLAGVPGLSCRSLPLKPAE